MYVVTVEFKIDTAHWEAFLPLMLENAARSRDDEPGCRQFDVCIDVCTDESRPATVFLYELYDDRAAFDAHLASSHFREFAAATSAMILQRSVLMWTRISGS